MDGMASSIGYERKNPMETIAVRNVTFSRYATTVQAGHNLKMGTPKYQWNISVKLLIYELKRLGRKRNYRLKDERK
jgi:hypothetical protein